MLALGIAYQLAEQFDEAIETFRVALAAAPDHPLLYNSLAMTQKKMGQPEKAAQNYDAGAMALTRRIVARLSNSPANPVLPHAASTHNLWLERAIYGAMIISSRDKTIEAMAMPTGDSAEREHRTREHKGLLWTDCVDSEGKRTRYFLPNYFNTFYFELCADRTYADLVGNRGTVLQMLGRSNEAEAHFQEAEEFFPQEAVG